MDILQSIKSNIANMGVSSVDHFSIEKIGRKFYLYAHSDNSSLEKNKIGRYNSYEAAKTAVDNILDLRLASYGS